MTFFKRNILLFCAFSHHFDIKGAGYQIRILQIKFQVFKLSLFFIYNIIFFYRIPIKNVLELIKLFEEIIHGRINIFEGNDLSEKTLKQYSMNFFYFKFMLEYFKDRSTINIIIKSLI